MLNYLPSGSCHASPYSPACRHAAEHHEVFGENYVRCTVSSCRCIVAKDDSILRAVA